MDISIRFQGEMGLAPFVTSSDLLERSWDVISSRLEDIVSSEGLRISWNVYKDSCVKIIAFKATQDYVVQPDLVTSSDLKEKKLFHDFDFLPTESNPIFSVNNTAVSLFIENLNELNQLKSEIISCSNPLIVTGHALGGSVASLFTISLLNSIGSGKNRPLCITFGSPLIGDKGLQEAISRSSNWNSCFLHVVSHKDQIPRLFITNNGSQTNDYMPYGTFLLCSDENSACFENPGSILRLFRVFNSKNGGNQGSQPVDYGEIVKILKQKTLVKDLSTLPRDIINTHTETKNYVSQVASWIGDLLTKKNSVETQHERRGGTKRDTLLASIILQLSALGLAPAMQPQELKKYAAMMEKEEEKIKEMRMKFFDPYVNLNIMKIDMAKLEWYKKKAKVDGIGYYDKYKRRLQNDQDRDVEEFKDNLTDYWAKMVEVGEIKSQKEGSYFRAVWLGSGTNYRRMVEPLAIAQYYRMEGNKDYVTKNRPKHFKLLEDWLKEGTTEASSHLTITLRKKNLEDILTKDSCFWALVEEALLSCKELKVAKEKEEGDIEEIG